MKAVSVDQIAFSGPTDNQILALSRQNPDFVPTAVGRRLHPIFRTDIESHPVPADLTTEDYVLGLETLGYVLS